MAEDRREQELRAAAKQLAGVQRQHRPDQTAAARSQAGQKAQPQRAAQQATTQTANSNGSRYMVVIVVLSLHRKPL